MSHELIKITCPECRGPIWKEREGKIVQYRCRVGHLYSPMAFAEEHRTTVERLIWETIVALEESADIAETFGDQLGPAAADEVKATRTQIAYLKDYLDKSPRRT